MTRPTSKGMQDPGQSHAMLAEIAAELADEIPGIPIEIAIRHLPAVPSVHEVHALMSAAEDDAVDYLAIRLLYYTGVRVGELVAIRFADVSSEDGTIFVRGGKGDEDRYVCVDEKTLKLVDARRGKKPGERVVGMTTREVEQAVNEYGRRVGIVQKYEGMARTFSPHSLRHAFGTHRYDAGMDVFTIKKLLGHRFLETTLIYTNTSMAHARKVYKKSDPFRGKS